MVRERLIVDITSATIFRTALILLTLWLLYQVVDVVLMIFGAIIIASAIEPIANYLQRWRIPRAISVAVVYFGVLLILAGVVSLMIEPVTVQSRQLIAVIPATIEQGSQLLPLLPEVDQATIERSIRESISRFGGNITNAGINIFQGTRNLFSGFITILFVFIMALYLVVERDALKKLAKVVTPPNHLLYVERVIERAQRGVGRWVLGQIVLGTIVGTLIGLGLWFMGVPYALLLGILAGVMEIVPVIGPIIAAIPGLIVALSQGWVVGLVALVYYVVIGQIESHILIPNIMKRAVGLRPLVTIIAVLLGARLAGVIGIIFAVPTAAIISVVVKDIFTRPTKPSK